MAKSWWEGERAFGAGAVAMERCGGQCSGESTGIPTPVPQESSSLRSRPAERQHLCPVQEGGACGELCSRRDCGRRRPAPGPAVGSVCWSRAGRFHRGESLLSVGGDGRPEQRDLGCKPSCAKTLSFLSLAGEIVSPKVTHLWFEEPSAEPGTEAAELSSAKLRVYIGCIPGLGLLDGYPVDKFRGRQSSRSVLRRRIWVRQRGV